MDFLDVSEDAAMGSLLLQRPVETLGHTSGPGFGNEGKARLDASRVDLPVEVVGRVLRAVVHSQLESLACMSAGATEIVLKALRNRLHGRETAPGHNRTVAIVSQNRRSNFEPT